MHILLIDDNPDDRELAKRAIVREIADVSFSEVGNETTFSEELERLLNYACVVTDYRMGWSDGLAVLERCRERASEVPVIMFTNTGNELVCAAGMKAGLADYILKRKDTYMLLGPAIRDAVELRRVRADLRSKESRVAELLERERAARAEAEVARIEAERANRVKDEFLATVSHELRTPLNSILGWATLLRTGNAAANDIQEGLAVIERNAQAQSQLIADLLDLARIISGKLRMDLENFELATVVRSTIESMKPEAERKGVVLRSLLEEGTGMVRGDPSRIGQIVANLLGNAIKFTGSGKSVDVTLQRVNSHIELAVRDEGIGIDAEALPAIFERFRQADSSISRRHGGLGIGLAIARSLAELHGGRLSAQSDGPGHGAEFTLFLPIALLRSGAMAAPELEANAALHEGRNQQALGGIVILAVDDDPDARDVLARVLEICGATVLRAASAAEALDQMKTAPIDILLSDIGMPEEDGYELIAKVRDLPVERGGNVAAVAITAFARAEDRQRAMLAGFDSHLSKPVDPNDLVALVTSVAHRLGRERA